MKIGDNALITALRFGMYKNRKQDDTYSISRPITQVVHGIRVDKAPVGRYLDFTKRLPNLVMEVLDATFPDMKPDDILTLLSGASANPQVIRDLITRLISVAPEKLLDVMSGIMAVDREKLLALTPADLMDVLEAFWKLNDYTDFFQRARRAVGAMRSHPNGLSSAGSPAEPVSESANGN